MSQGNQTHNLPSYCIEYVLFLSNILAKEFSQNFKVFCEQNNLSLSDALLKDVYLVVIRQIKQKLLTDMDGICLPRSSNLEAKSGFEVNRSFTRNLSAISVESQKSEIEDLSSDCSEVELNQNKFMYRRFFRHLSLRKVSKG